MDADKISQLKSFIHHCQSNPSALLDPSLAFFRSYLQSLGAKISPDSSSMEGHVKKEDGDGIPYVIPKKEEAGDKVDDIVESDLELDDEIIKPDVDPPQKMGDPSVEASEESCHAAQMSKAKALDTIIEGKLDEAIEHLTNAILLNPTSAILYATRASVFVKLRKPNAAIRDTDAALQINPDSAKGYKYRGMSKAMLGHWEEAAKDLHLASQLDHDDEIQSMLKKVEPNVRKIEEHKRKYERLQKEREVRRIERERQRRHAEAEQASKLKDPESLAALQDGSVLSVRSSNDLETKLKAASKLSRLVVLYFTATWCGPCRAMAPLYKSFAEKYPKVVFLKADIDEVGEVARRWNVSSVPTFFFSKNGKEIDKVVGADKNGLERKIAQHAV